MGHPSRRTFVALGESQIRSSLHISLTQLAAGTTFACPMKSMQQNRTKRPICTASRVQTSLRGLNWQSLSEQSTSLTLLRQNVREVD